MREHNTPAVAPIASLTAFDGKGHADPKVNIKPPAPRHNGIGDLLRAVQYRSFEVGSPAPVVNDKFAHAGVRIDSGLNIAAIDRRIIVPPGWFLRLASFGGNVAPAASLHIGLLLAFVESDQLTAEAAELLTT